MSQDAVVKPPLRRANMTQTVRYMELNKVVGYGDATWYSPSASTCMRPVAEMLAARDAFATRSQNLLDKVWLCRLVDRRTVGY
jgi:hypothetical protein